MKRNEYERILLRLEEQRRTGIALVESAYQAQVRSVELVWRLQGEEGFEGLGTVLAIVRQGLTDRTLGAQTSTAGTFPSVG